MSDFPKAIDATKVGTYPALVKSGGGYFYDEVLEYRVWLHLDDDGDSYHAFADYETALKFSQENNEAEEPLVLVLQKEHVNEPKPGVFEHIKEERLTEWLVEWLEGSKREEDSISKFLKKAVE